MNLRTQVGTLITIGAMIAAGCNENVTSPPDEVPGPAVGSIVLQLEADTLSVDQTTQLRATVLSVDGNTLTDEAITFVSSDEDIVTVSDTGLVTAEGSGTATLTVQAGDRSATVTVYVRRAASISIAPSGTALSVDDTLRLTATVLDADGAPLAFAVVRWFDDNADALRILRSNRGFTAEFLATSVGNEVITAETEGLTTTVDVRVDPSEVGSVILSPDSLTVAVGDTARVTVVVRDTTGAVIADPHVVISCGGGPEGFCVSRGSPVATIDPTGLVTGVSKRGERWEVVVRYKGVNSNTIYLRVVDPVVVPCSGTCKWAY